MEKALFKKNSLEADQKCSTLLNSLTAIINTTKWLNVEKNGDFAELFWFFGSGGVNYLKYDFFINFFEWESSVLSI